MFTKLRQTLSQNPTLRGALIASILFFVVVIGWRFIERSHDTRVRQANNQLIQAEQAWLAARVNRLIAADESDKAELVSRLNWLTDQQESAGVRAGEPPFSIESLLPSIVEIFCIDNESSDVYYTASGTIIDEAGLILTNRHALTSEDGSYIKYCGVGFTADQRKAPQPEYVAAVMAIHKSDDLAVLRVTERVDGNPVDCDFEAMPLTEQTATAEALNLGDTIYIGGYPGLGAETFTLTQGVVSGRVGDGLIQTSALIDSGTSGGAAFDAQGQFIGVPTAAVQGDIGGTLGYLIAADVVDRFLKDFYSNQEVIDTLEPVE